MASFNQWTGIGNLGSDPEQRYLPNGDAVANVSIACNETWKDKNGDKQERVEWVRLVFWRRLAEIVGEYLHKGDSIFVQGKLVTRSYEKEGQTHYSTEVHVSEMRMIGSKRDGGGDTQRDEGETTRPPPNRSSGQQQANRPSRQASTSRKVDDFDDDIPF